VSCPSLLHWDAAGVRKLCDDFAFALGTAIKIEFDPSRGGYRMRDVQAAWLSFVGNELHAGRSDPHPQRCRTFLSAYFRSDDAALEYSQDSWRRARLRRVRRRAAAPKVAPAPPLNADTKDTPELQRWRNKAASCQVMTPFPLSSSLGGRNVYALYPALQSDVLGLGLRVGRKIPKDTLVARFTGVEINNNEATRRRRLHKPDGDAYFFRVPGTGRGGSGHRRHIDARRSGGIARFANHACCERNAEFVDEEGEVWIRALRDVNAGEFLTVDYGWDVKDGFVCKCGVGQCRG
jgi:hypothetical protein